MTYELPLNTRRAYSAYEVVTPLDLAVGDLVLAHGGVFRVREANRWDSAGSVVQSNHSEFVCDANSDDDCAIPLAWRDLGGRGWNVQGNEHARCCRITDPTPQYFRGRDPETGLYVWGDQPVQAL